MDTTTTKPLVSVKELFNGVLYTPQDLLAEVEHELLSQAREDFAGKIKSLKYSVNATDLEIKDLLKRVDKLTKRRDRQLFALNALRDGDYQAVVDYFAKSKQDKKQDDSDD